MTFTVPASATAKASHEARAPRLGLALRWKQAASGARHLEAHGRTSYAGSARVRLEVRRPAGWMAAGAATVADHRYRADLKLPTAPGVRVRATLGSGRLKVTALEATPEELPYRLKLDDPDGLAADTLGTRMTFHVDAQAGDFVSIVVDDSTASDPATAESHRIDIEALAQARPSVRFTASVEGTYTAHLTGLKPGHKTIWASTPATVAGQVGAPVDVSGRRSFQPVDVEFTGEGGAPLNLPDLGPGAGELIGPDGTVDPWLSDPQAPDVYLLPEDGDYVLRLYNPDNTVEIASVLSAEAVVGGPDITFSLSSPQDVALVEIPASADQPFYVDLAPLCGHRAALFGPDGGPAIAAATAQTPVDGTYYLVVGGLEGSPEVTVSVGLPHDIIAS